MKSTRTFSGILAAALLITFAPISHAEDWKTIDGKCYQNVTVLHCEPDAVTILDKNGGALIPLELLPDDLQKRFHYDPEKAKAAADARMQQEIADARAMRAERVALANRRQAEADESARAADCFAGNSPEAGSPSTAASSSTHYSMDDLVGSTSSLQRDLTDPSYHTMNHLAIEARSLQPDANDPNHHTISEITNPSP